MMQALPTFFSFLLILAFGFIISYLLQKIVYKIFQKSNLLLKKLSKTSEKRLSYLPERAMRVISKVIFWVAFFFFFMAALHFTGFQKIELGLDRFIYFIPNLFTAGVIFFVGWFISLYTQNIFVDFCAERNLKQGPYLSGGVKWLVLIVFFDLALMQLGVKTSVINSLIILFVGAFLSGLVISFAIGSREFVENLIASHTLQKHYEIGQKIRLEVIEGTILKFSSTGVVLLTKQGEALVPAKSILQQTSILLKGG
jgi:hypothetical protein